MAKIIDTASVTGLLLERLVLSSLSVQGRLQDEGAEQNEDAGAQAEPPCTASEADPFGLDEIMQKEDASK